MRWGGESARERERERERERGRKERGGRETECAASPRLLGEARRL